MLGLKLRAEFLGSHMPGTAISLRTNDNQGAVQKSPDQILSITYPTADVIRALKAIRANRDGNPIVLIGERGRGKSHIMAVLHHAIASPNAVEGWLHEWGTNLGSNELQTFEIVKGYVAISEPVHNYEYPLLWDLLFDRHPKGQYFRGQFETLQQPFPPRTLLEKMFESQPTCLILDEFQTWFTGLPEKDPKTGLLLRQYAFAFVQILAEIAKERPDLLIFIISVLNNQNDAFQQVHRQSPIIVDFRGPSAKQDRQKLLLHRLFENRRNIGDGDIADSAGTYASERFRLLHADKSGAEKSRIDQEVFDCWPFAPELLGVLEDHILMSEAAQETRDMIRILAQVYRTRGDAVPVLTPADFFVDGESDEVQTLVDSIAVQADQDKLRQIAQRNLEAVRESGNDLPHARELISAIWMRSMSPGRHSGGSPTQLHLDITRGQVIDDNNFQVELAALIENSVNIHGDEVPGGALWFGVNENPRSKVRAVARNNKLWDARLGSVMGQTSYPGKDVEHIRKTVRHLLVSETAQPPSRVIVLGPNWQNDPWREVDEVDKPAKWERPILLVIPSQMDGGRGGINTTLGSWLVKHVSKRRNTVRFLLPANDAKGLYNDDELSFAARCSFLCSKEAWGTDSTYRSLLQDFDRSLRQALKSRFNRFAVLRKWDFQQPQNCSFEVEKITQQGTEIPGAVEEKILIDLFDQSDFKRFVLQQAQDDEFVGSLMDDLIEPPPPGAGEAIPYLGETKLYELVLEIAAQGDLALNVGGTWIIRRPEDTDDEDARRYVRSRAFRTGQEMRQIQLGLPGSVGGGTVTAPPLPANTSQSTIVTNTAPSANTPTSKSDGTTAPPVLRERSQDYDAPSATPTVAPALRTKKSEEPATGINLSGAFENWGVATTQTLTSARIEFNGLTAQQIKQILQRIPSTFKATLEITYSEGADS